MNEMPAVGEVHKCPWGNYRLIERGSDHVVKIITVAPMQALSLQYHEHRHEHWLSLSGVADVQIGDERQVLFPYCSVDIAPRTVHRIVNNHHEPVVILEVQYGQTLSEADIVRLHDRYGRGRTCTTNRDLIPPVVIAEVGCNHKGDMDIALDMIRIASQFSKVDVVKFQKRTNRELLSPEEYDAPHPNPANSYGPTYGLHREALEFTKEQHAVLKAACDDWGVVYSTSVWDLTSAKEIVALEPQLIKVPSAVNTNLAMMDYLLRDYGGELHISLGMTTKDEERRLIELADKLGRLKDIVLYHCTSGYPVPLDQLYLREIPHLIETYGSKVKAIGFSGHHNGIAADVAAMALGAQYFERHFTLDRTWKGTDHAASLEPDGMRRLTRDLKEIAKAMRFKPSEICEIEEAQRVKLKRFQDIQPAATGG